MLVNLKGVKRMKFGRFNIFGRKRGTEPGVLFKKRKRGQGDRGEYLKQGGDIISEVDIDKEERKEAQEVTPSLLTRLRYGISYKFENFMEERRKVQTIERGDYTISRRHFYNLEKQVFRDGILLAGIGIYQRSCREMVDISAISISDEKLDKEFKEEVWPNTKSHFQHTFLSMNPFHQGVFGSSLVEYVKGVKSKKIIDFLTADIRQYDFVQEAGKPKVEQGMPWGFWDTSDMKLKYKRDKHMLHSGMIKLHNMEWPVGWVELMYVPSRQKVATQDARTQKNVRKGYPVPIISYGKETVAEPSPTMRGEAKKIAKGLVKSTTVAATMPYYMQLKFLDEYLSADTDKSMIEDEMHITRLQAAQMGIPVPVYLMTMQDQPSVGVRELSEFFEVNLKSFVRDLDIEKAIYRWAKDRTEKDIEVDINYDEILIHTSKERMMQIFRAGKIDILFSQNAKHNEAIRNELLRRLGLPSSLEFIDAVDEATTGLEEYEKKRGGYEQRLKMMEVDLAMSSTSSTSPEEGD